MRNTFVFTFILSLSMLLFNAGCNSTEKGVEDGKMQAEDYQLVNTFAAEIAIMQNPALRANSKAKYDAAKRLADGIDFSFLRNVRTMIRIFGLADLQTTESELTTRHYLYSYQYQDKSIRFLFTGYGEAITRVEIKEN